MKSIFTHEEIEYIVDNYQNKTYKQITAEINTFKKIWVNMALSHIRKEEEWKYILHLKHSYKSLLDNIYKDATVFLDRKYNIYKKIMA